jgi:hypothetical protein
MKAVSLLMLVVAGIGSIARAGEWPQILSGPAAAASPWPLAARSCITA